MQCSVHPKFLETLMLLIQKQNRELVEIIAEEENINIFVLQKLVPSQHKIMQTLQDYRSSSSEDSSESSSSDPDVE